MAIETTGLNGETGGVVNGYLHSRAWLFSYVVTDEVVIVIYCNVMQCNAMRRNAMQCNAMQCNAMQCNVMQCNVMM